MLGRESTERSLVLPQEVLWTPYHFPPFSLTSVSPQHLAVIDDSEPEPESLVLDKENLSLEEYEEQMKVRRT
jgi:hypothetical protein